MAILRAGTLDIDCGATAGITVGTGVIRADALGIGGGASGGTVARTATDAGCWLAGTTADFTAITVDGGNVDGAGDLAIVESVGAAERFNPGIGGTDWRTTGAPVAGALVGADWKANGLTTSGIWTGCRTTGRAISSDGALLEAPGSLTAGVVSDCVAATVGATGSGAVMSGTGLAGLLKCNTRAGVVGTGVSALP